MRIEFQATKSDVNLWKRAAKADGRSLSAMLRKAATREAIAIMALAVKVNTQPARRKSK